MAEQSKDPAEAFRNLITDWERNFDSMANKFMGTSEYSKAMNQFQNLQLEMQKRFNDLMAHNLSNLNMPSRDDILRLGESIRSIEKRLAAIEVQLAKKSNKDKKGKRKGPPRTKLPPSQSSEKTS
jgi:hypothetical protein